MSKRLDTMSTAGAAAADTLKCVNFPEKNLCGGLLLRFYYPVTIVGPGPNTPPTMNQLAAAAIGSLSLRYGPGGNKVVYPTVPGVEMRNVSRYATRLECPNNISSVAWDVGGASTVRFDLLIPFQLETAPDGKKRLPGWSQMKGVIIDLVEGSALNVSAGNISRGAGSMIVDVDVFTFPSEIDQAGPLLSYARANQSSLRAEGPELLLAGAWELSAAQASTAISLFSLDVGGVKEEDTVPPYVPGDKYQLLYDTGSSPITDEVTMAYSPWQNQPASEFPIGTVVFELAAQDIAQIQLRMLGWPMETLEEAKANAKEASKSGPVVAQKDEIVDTVPEGVARTLPAKFFRPGHPKFTLGEGLVAPGGGAEPYLSLPDFKTITAGAAVETAATSGAQTMAASQSSILAGIGKRVPGVASMVVKSNKAAEVEPNQWAEALKIAAGDKGSRSVGALLTSMKL